MQYRFPYNNLPPLEIPDNNLVGVFEAGQVHPTASSADIVRHALDNPVGAPGLAELASRASSALILSDDNTRYTPAHLVVPHVLDDLRRGGIGDDAISILIAKGTHRTMSRDELIDKLGADVVVGIGNIIPHCIKGFSGGSNIVLPGVSGTDAIGAMHWLNLDCFGEEILGVRDNRVRALIDEVAKAAGLTYIVNTIVNNDNAIIAAVAGDPVAAHRHGAKTASDVFSIDIPKRADIVIFDAFQNDLDFWQSTKGLIPAYICMKQDAVVIDVADCPEGICHNIPEVGANGFSDLGEIMRLHESGALHPVVTHNLISVYRVVTERGRCITVSQGITKEAAEHAGLLHADSPAEALDKAFAMKGPDADIIVLRHAGNIRPVIQDPAL